MKKILLISLVVLGVSYTKIYCVEENSSDQAYIRQIENELLVYANRNMPFETFKQRLEVPGLNVNASLENGITLLIQRIIRNKSAEVALLLEKGADANICPNGYTPLMYAASTDKDAVITQLLLQHGAHPERVNAGGRIAEQIARSNGRDDIAEMFIHTDQLMDIDV